MRHTDPEESLMHPAPLGCHTEAQRTRRTTRFLCVSVTLCDTSRELVAATVHADLVSGLEPLRRQAHVVAAEAERVAERQPHRALHRAVGGIVQVTVRVALMEVDRRRDPFVDQGSAKDLACKRIHAAAVRSSTSEVATPRTSASNSSGSAITRQPFAPRKESVVASPIRLLPSTEP
jgi:hypothetical protein